MLYIRDGRGVRCMRTEYNAILCEKFRLPQENKRGVLDHSSYEEFLGQIKGIFDEGRGVLILECKTYNKYIESEADYLDFQSSLNKVEISFYYRVIESRIYVTQRGNDGHKILNTFDFLTHHHNFFSLSATILAAHPYVTIDAISQTVGEEKVEIDINTYDRMDSTIPLHVFIRVPLVESEFASGAKFSITHTVFSQKLMRFKSKLNELIKN